MINNLKFRIQLLKRHKIWRWTRLDFIFSLRIDLCEQKLSNNVLYQIQENVNDILTIWCFYSIEDLGLFNFQIIQWTLVGVACLIIAAVTALLIATHSKIFGYQNAL